MSDELDIIGKQAESIAKLQRRVGQLRDILAHIVLRCSRETWSSESTEAGVAVDRVTTWTCRLCERKNERHTSTCPVPEAEAMLDGDVS